MVKTRIRPVTESGYPKARTPVDPYNLNESTNSNESEKEPSENRTTVVKQNHAEKYKRTKPSER